METTEPTKQPEEPRVTYLLVEGESTALDEVFDLLFGKLDSQDDK
jgi:hypothetical protein